MGEKGKVEERGVCIAGREMNDLRGLGWTVVAGFSFTGRLAINGSENRVLGKGGEANWKMFSVCKKSVSK